jgi:HEAT repeat protein
MLEFPASATVQGALDMKNLLLACLGVLALAAGTSRAVAQVPAPAPRDPVLVLAQQLRDNDVNVRRAAARALTRLPNTTAAIPALIESLKDEDPFVRDNAVDGLAVMNPGDVVPSLARALRDPNPNARRRGADCLARIGHDTQDSWPALIELLKDENQAVRKSATAALRHLLLGKWD